MNSTYANNVLKNLGRLPKSYLILWIGLGIAILFLSIFTGNPAKLKGGKRIIKDGPLGNAQFASKEELDNEYPTIHYNFQSWCDIGQRREKFIFELDYAFLVEEISKMENFNEELKGKAKQVIENYTKLVGKQPTIFLGSKNPYKLKISSRSDLYRICTDIDNNNKDYEKAKEKYNNTKDASDFKFVKEYKRELERSKEERKKIWDKIYECQDEIKKVVDKIIEYAKNSKENNDYIEDILEYSKQREEKYTELSTGLPTEPGILLGDWHEKDSKLKGPKIINPIGKRNAEAGGKKRGKWPNYPWYSSFKERNSINPVNGKKIKEYVPLSIREYKENDDGSYKWKNHKENWYGGAVMTRLCTDDIHAMMVASSGAGKSAFFLYPQSIYSMCCGISFVITDTKGDNAKALSQIAHDCFGYKTLSLDLRNPQNSCKFNIMHMVNKYTDLYDACEDKNSPDAIKYAAKREAYAKLVANTIVKGSNIDYGQNAYFYDSATGLVQACILLVSEYGNKGKAPDGRYDPAYDNRHIVSVYHLIQDVSGTQGTGDKKKTGISVMLDELDPDDKIRFFAGPSAQNSGDSQASVVSTAMSKLLSFLDTEMEQVLCGRSDIDAEDFCKEKTILFITMPEENNTRYFLVSLVVSELYNELLTIASQNGNYVPTPKGFRGKDARIMFYLDEFGTLPRIDGFEMMMSAARSRGMFFLPILQGITQLERNYGKESAKIIMDNCKLTFFSGISSTSEDAEFFSKKMGIQTIEMNSVSNNANLSGSGRSKNRSLSMTAQPLMSADEIRNMKKGDFVILRTADAGNTGHPIKCHFDIFMDWGITLGNTAIDFDKDIIPVHYSNRYEILHHINLQHLIDPLPLSVISPDELAKAEPVQEAMQYYDLPIEDDDDDETDEE